MFVASVNSTNKNYFFAGKLLLGLPKNWEDMNGALVKSVSLQPSAPEYQDAEKKFRATCRTQRIEKVNSDCFAG